PETRETIRCKLRFEPGINRAPSERHASQREDAIAVRAHERLASGNDGVRYRVPAAVQDLPNHASGSVQRHLHKRRTAGNRLHSAALSFATTIGRKNADVISANGNVIDLPHAVETGLRRAGHATLRVSEEH